MSEVKYQLVVDRDEKTRTFLEVDALLERIGEIVMVAGKIQKIRKLGNLTFLVLQTFKDKLQVVFLGEKVNLLGSLKEGDYITVEGAATANTEAYRGIEVLAEKIEVLAEGTAVNFQQNQEFSDPRTRAHFRLKEGVVRLFSDCMAGIHLTEVPSIREGIRDALGRVLEKEPSSLRGFGELVYRQSFLPAFGGVYTISSAKDELACEIGYQTSTDSLMAEVVGFLSSLESLQHGRYARELSILGVNFNIPQSIPSVDFEDVRRQVAKVFSYTPPNKGILLPEERELISRFIEKETGSGMVFVTKPPSSERPIYAMRNREDSSHTEEFILIAQGGVQLITGGLRTHVIKDQENVLLRYGITPALVENYLQVHRIGLPPHGGFTIDVTSLLLHAAGLERLPYIRAPRPIRTFEVTDENEFNARDFLFGSQRLALPILENRARHVQCLEDNQVASLMKTDMQKDPETDLPPELIAILPEFAMNIADVEFLLDLIPNQRKKILSEPPGKVLQYLWSILGHDHVKSIMKSQQMRIAARELSEMGILTDYAQLKFLHEEMLDNLGRLAVYQLKSINSNKLTDIACKRITARKESDYILDPEIRSKITRFIETEDEEFLGELNESDRSIVIEVLENGKKRVQFPLTKFTKRLLSSRPNAMATVIHTVTKLADAGRPLPIDGKDEGTLWEAIDANCATPILYYIFTKLQANKEAFTNFKKILRDNFSRMHRNEEIDPTEVTNQFYEKMETFCDYLGDSFFGGKENIYPELVHYFYRPVNMDISTLTSHLSKIGGETADLDELSFNFGGEHWEPESGCYSFAYEEEGSDKVLQLYFTKSSAGFFGKTTAGICTLNDQALFKRKDHFHINLVDGETQLVVGNAQGYVIDRSGRKAILLRAINPSEAYVNMANAQDILKSVIRSVTELAENSGIDEIYISESKGVWHAHSSREPIKAILDLLYEHLEEIVLEEPFPIYNFYGVDKTIEKVYQLFGKQPVA